MVKACFGEPGVLGVVYEPAGSGICNPRINEVLPFGWTCPTVSQTRKRWATI